MQVWSFLVKIVGNFLSRPGVLGLNAKTWRFIYFIVFGSFVVLRPKNDVWVCFGELYFRLYNPKTDGGSLKYQTSLATICCPRPWPRAHYLNFSYLNIFKTGQRTWLIRYIDVRKVFHTLYVYKCTWKCPKIRCSKTRPFLSILSHCRRGRKEYYR